MAAMQRIGANLINGNQTVLPDAFTFGLSFSARLPGLFLPDAAGMRWRRDDGAEFILLINRLKEDISSSAIRKQIRRGNEPVELNEHVREYVAKNSLYSL